MNDGLATAARGCAGDTCPAVLGPADAAYLARQACRLRRLQMFQHGKHTEFHIKDIDSSRTDTAAPTLTLRIIELRISACSDVLAYVNVFRRYLGTIKEERSMLAFGSWHWSALAITISFSAPAVQAGMITPDSIPNPPNAVASANGTPINANNIADNRYTGLGVNIANAAITRLNGVSVWAPLGVAAGVFGRIDYAHSVGGVFVSPTSLTRTTLSSLSVDLIGISGPPNLWVDGLKGQWLNIVPVMQSTPGPDGGQVWTFTGPGISAFGVLASPSTTGPWGVSEVSFTPATAPEPSSLVLAGLGTLGLVARFAWRRTRWVA